MTKYDIEGATNNQNQFSNPLASSETMSYSSTEHTLLVPSSAYEENVESIRNVSVSSVVCRLSGKEVETLVREGLYVGEDMPVGATNQTTIGVGQPIDEVI